MPAGQVTRIRRGGRRCAGGGAPEPADGVQPAPSDFSAGVGELLTALPSTRTQGPPLLCVGSPTRRCPTLRALGMVSRIALACRPAGGYRTRRCASSARGAHRGVADVVHPSAFRAEAAGLTLGAAALHTPPAGPSAAPARGREPRPGRGADRAPRLMRRVAGRAPAGRPRVRAAVVAVVVVVDDRDARAAAWEPPRPPAEGYGPSEVVPHQPNEVEALLRTGPTLETWPPFPC